jgi:hypothetical protein
MHGLVWGWGIQFQLYRWGEYVPWPWPPHKPQPLLERELLVTQETVGVLGASPWGYTTSFLRGKSCQSPHTNYSGLTSPK